MYAWLAHSQVIQKVGLIDHPKWELASMVFLYLRSEVLTTPTETNLPYLHLSRQGGGLPIVQKLGDLCTMFYDNIMMTLSTDFVPQFHAYWQICDNH
jgi:hypothetical protein